MKNRKKPPTPAMLLEHARANRREHNEVESLAWFLLRKRRLDDLRFRRQQPIGPYIVDFYCHEARLVVELDGGQHVEREAKDDARTRYLEGKGLRVIRFWNNDVLGQTDEVMQQIVDVARERSPRKEET